MSARIHQHVKVPLSAAGSRFDQVASDLFPDYSRSRLQQWIKSGALRADQRQLKPKIKLAGGELLELDAELEAQECWLPEDIPLDIVYADEQILVLNKPAGLVVHPAAGNWSGTLLNALLFQFPELNQLPRAGIVHRLDKDTSGLMVVARTLHAQVSLVEQLQARSVSRVYWALVHGHPEARGLVDAPLGRHPSARTKMAVVREKDGGKEARTHFQVMGRYGPLSLLELRLETGRTHQIRVHMLHEGHPLVGDPVYGRKLNPVEKESLGQGIAEAVNGFARQALHAKELALLHPVDAQRVSWEAAVPGDFLSLLATIECLHHR